jgi:hypothetical protein
MTVAAMQIEYYLLPNCDYPGIGFGIQTHEEAHDQVSSIQNTKLDILFNGICILNVDFVLVTSTV